MRPFCKCRATAERRRYGNETRCDEDEDWAELMLRCCLCESMADWRCPPSLFSVYLVTYGGGGGSGRRSRLCMNVNDSTECVHYGERFFGVRGSKGIPSYALENHPNFLFSFSSSENNNAAIRVHCTYGCGTII